MASLLLTLMIHLMSTETGEIAQTAFLEVDKNE
jgi:hypothetical protein